jgi:hypothetical protein
VQFNGRTDWWRDGSIHECSLLADVSSEPLALSNNSLRILPRERSKQVQWIANRSPAFYHRIQPRAFRTADRLSFLRKAVQSQRIATMALQETFRNGWKIRAKNYICTEVWRTLSRIRTVALRNFAESKKRRCGRKRSSAQGTIIHCPRVGKYLMLATVLRTLTRSLIAGRILQSSRGTRTVCTGFRTP